MLISSRFFSTSFTKSSLVGCSCCAKNTFFNSSESSLLNMCFKKCILLCTIIHLIGTTPYSKYKNSCVVFACEFNMPFISARSRDYKLAMCASVRPCQASLLCRIPFKNIASLILKATSNLRFSKGISFMIESISATMPVPLSFLFVTVAWMFPVSSIISPCFRI